MQTNDRPYRPRHARLLRMVRLEDLQMNPQAREAERQPFSVLAARLAAQKPWLSWSQVCSELARRPRRKKREAVAMRLPYADN